MPRPTTRTEVLQKLRDTISKNEIIVGAGAGGCDPYVSLLLNTHLMNFQVLGFLQKASRRGVVILLSCTILAAFVWLDVAHWLE